MLFRENYKKMQYLQLEMQRAQQKKLLKMHTAF